MKILYVANIRLPTEKAHGVQIMKMCEAFANAGVEVELVVTDRKTPIKEDPFEYYGVKTRFMLTRLPTLDLVFLGGIGFWMQTLSFVWAASRYIRHSSADVVYSRDPALFFFGAVPKSKKLIWEVHARPTKRVLRKVLNLPVSVVAISKGLKEFMVQQGFPPARIMVAHDGVDLSEFESVQEKDQLRKILYLPQDKKLVGYIGKLRTMGESKGVEVIIEAVGHAHAQMPEAALLIVGLNADEMNEVRGLARKAGLPNEAIYLVGHVPHTVAVQYLCAADVLVMNYPNAPHYARIMSPLKLFEYMASGTPIVTSDLPSIREVLPEDAAYFIEPESTHSLIFGITQTLSDPSAPERSRRAREEVAQYTWGKRAHKVLDFIQ
jgi:glycosyltransferase involved in cell wall biosynthesis